MTEHVPSNDPDPIRAEIGRLLAGIADTATLLFCRWMFHKIANDEPMPPDSQIRPLCESFVRVLQAIRGNRKINRNDWQLLVEYMDVAGLEIARPLAATRSQTAGSEGSHSASGQRLVRLPSQMADRIGAWSDFRPFAARVRAIESGAPNEPDQSYGRVGEAIGLRCDNISGHGGGRW
jgi:hypothetical protein